MMTCSDGCGRQFCFGELEVDARDVITVAEALAACRADEVFEAVLDAEAGWRVSPEALDGACRTMLIRKIEASLRCMRSVAPRSNAHPESVVVPWERFEMVDARGALRRRVGAAVLSKADVPEVAALLGGGVGRVASLFALREAKSCVESRCDGRPWSWERLAWSAAPLAFEPWSETLGRRMWVPRSLCERERCHVVGSVFWAMTYFGFDAARAGWRAGEGGGCGGLGVAGADALLAEGLFSPGLLADGLSRADEEYVSRIMRIVSLANYNSWVDLLQALLALSDREEAA